MDSIIGAGLCYVPVGLAIAVIYVMRMNQRDTRRAPFDELQRRPAGETLRRELEGLNDKLNDETLGLVLFPGLLALVYFYQHPQDPLTALLFFVLSAGTAWFFGYRLLQLIKVRAALRLGYEGERYVGEELSQLIGLGCEIYHDVPFEGYNMDHVVVGPCGVFLVETKTYSMPVNEAGKKEHKVRFDGQALHWPWGIQNREIEQAKRSAKSLSSWLGTAAGEKIWVTPILTLPGWWVDRKVPSEKIQVLNPKEIYQVCEAQPKKLTEPQIKRICHQLNQKCRIAVS